MKKVISGFLTIGLLAFIVACGSSNSDSGSDCNTISTKGFVSGKLHLENRTCGSTGRNYLWFQNPSNVSSIKTSVTVLDYSESNADAQARIGGVFYNDGTSGATSGSSLGDVWAQLVTRGSDISYYVGSCTTTSSCSATTRLDSGILGTVTLGQTYTFLLTWDEANSTFSFQLDNNTPVTFNPTSQSPIANSTPNNPRMILGTKISPPSGETGSGYLDVYFDDVYVNGSLYDDFSSGSIDTSKWY